MQNPFSNHLDEINNKATNKITKDKINKIITNKKYSVFTVIFIITALIIFALYLFAKINNYQAPTNLNLEYTIALGYKFNYNSNWNPMLDPIYGLILTNKDQTTITMTFSKANTNNLSLDQTVKNRLDSLKDKYIELNTQDIILNNLTFKDIQLKNKTNENIVKPDTIHSYITLKDNMYIVITLVGKEGDNLDEANQIIKTFRTS